MEERQRNPSMLAKTGNIITDLVSVFAPAAACRLKSWRNVYFGYEAATPSRKDSYFPSDARAEAINKTSRRTIRARARDLERNSDVIVALQESLKNDVIGIGFNMQADSDNEVFNERIEALFKEWCKPKNIDITKQQSLNEMLRMMVCRLIVDGGILAVYSIDPKESFPLKVQLREVDDFADQDNPLVGEDRIISEGVEMTKYGKPVAYYLQNVDANGFASAESERIPVERCDFLWLKKRPSQFREISPLASSIVRIKDLEDYMGAVAFRQKTLACTSVFIETKNESGAYGRQVNSADGRRIENIEGGTVKYLRPGEVPHTLIPAGQASEVENYIVTQLRIISATQGYSLESATRNVERVNYSSARQNLNKDQVTCTVFRDFLQVHFLEPLYSRFVETCYLAGMLDGTGYDPHDMQYNKVKFLSGGIPWIDPLKEANADSVKLANGGLSFQAYCASQGVDWKERLREMKDVQDYAQELGVTLSYNPNTFVKEEEDGQEDVDS